MLFIALCFALTGIKASDAWAAPGDSEGDPIFVATPDQLNSIRYGLNKFYKLSDNLDMHDYLCPD